MARKKKQRGEYGAGTTYQNKKGEWFAAFPLGNGQRDTRRVADKQAGDAWRAEMKRQRDEQHIDIATAQTLLQWSWWRRTQLNQDDTAPGRC